MKVVVTVTAVYEFPDDIEIDGYDDEDKAGLCVSTKGHKFMPIVDFIKYDDPESDVEEDDEEELEGIYDILDDCLVSEDYTIIEIDEFGDDDEE